MRETRVRSLGREDSPGEGNGNPLQLPGKFHGQRSLVGYSPRGHKESDTTEWLHFTSTQSPRWLCVCPKQSSFSHFSFSPNTSLGLSSSSPITPPIQLCLRVSQNTFIMNSSSSNLIFISLDLVLIISSFLKKISSLGLCDIAFLKKIAAILKNISHFPEKKKKKKKSPFPLQPFMSPFSSKLHL